VKSACPHVEARRDWARPCVAPMPRQCALPGSWNLLASVELASRPHPKRDDCEINRLRIGTGDPDNIHLHGDAEASGRCEKRAEALA